MTKHFPTFPRFVQHYATPERQEKRRVVAAIGIRQYKKRRNAVKHLMHEGVAA